METAPRIVAASTRGWRTTRRMMAMIAPSASAAFAAATAPVAASDSCPVRTAAATTKRGTMMIATLTG